MKFLIDHMKLVTSCQSKKYNIISLMIDLILAGNLYFSQIINSAKSLYLDSLSPNSIKPVKILVKPVIIIRT